MKKSVAYWLVGFVLVLGVIGLLLIDSPQLGPKFVASKGAVAKVNILDKVLGRDVGEVGGGSRTATCASISQFGVTWTFDQPYPCGQFVNGDWWVVGPVNIIDIDPIPTFDRIENSGVECTNPLCSSILNAVSCDAEPACEWLWISGAEECRPLQYPANCDANSPAPLNGQHNYVAVECDSQNQCVYETTIGRNGWIINPSLGDEQPYDDRMPQLAYDKYLQPPLPSTVNSGSSVVSTKSGTLDCVDNYGRSGQLSDYRRVDGEFGCSEGIYLETAAVLTVLDTAPPANSFRPPYVGTSKPIFSANNVQTNYNNYFPSLAAPPGSYYLPPLSDVNRWFERPWLQTAGWWGKKYMVPVDNGIGYGTGRVQHISAGMLRLMLDDGDFSSKQEGIYGLIQIGIDEYGYGQAGGGYDADGAQQAGHFLTPVFAGLMIGDQNLLNSVSSNPTKYAELCQTFYTAQNPPYTNAPHPECYTPIPSSYGPDYPRYGAQYCENQPDYKGLGEPVTCYSAATNSYFGQNQGSWTGEALAAILLGIDDDVGHDAFFDFVDRCRNGDCGGAPVTHTIGFNDAMWAEYRDYVGDCTVSGCPADTACVSYTCNTGTGNCEMTPINEGNLCGDDGVYCNGEERCSAGSCLNTDPPCEDDGIACTIECDEANGCYGPVVLDNSQCADGRPCTSDLCVVGVGCVNERINGCYEEAGDLQPVPGPDDGFSLFLKMDGDLTDSSSQGNDFGCTSCPSPIDDQNGRPAAAYDFSNDVAYPVATLNGAFPAYDANPAEDFSFAAYVRLDSSSNRGPIIFKQGLGGRGFWFGFEEGGELVLEVSEDGVNSVQYPLGFSPVLGEWHHVVVTYNYDSVSDEATIAFYKDKSYIDSTSGVIGPVFGNSKPLEVGRYYWNSQYNWYLDGGLNDLRVYSKVLSAGEIAGF
ncbi:MAG: LamG domain-containing protein [archaeon]